MDQSGTGKSKEVVIVGAGLAGALLACYLAKRGWNVSVYERRPDPRAAGLKGGGGGRSINLALSARGLWGLEGVGLDKAVLEHAIPMRGRMMHDRAGDLAFQAYSKGGKEAINSVSRGGLNLQLIEQAAQYDNVRLFFNHRCLDVDLDECSVVFQNEDTSERTGDRVVTVRADLIVGADGAFSAVRAKMQKTDRFEYSQSYLTHGYKELHIPPAGDGRFAIEKNALHIWPRGSSMMIALPNTDGSFTCTRFWPFERGEGGEGGHSFAKLKTEEDVRRHFAAEYPDFPALSPTFVDDYFKNPTSSLVTVKCGPWHAMARDGQRGTVLIGDAAHAIVPFYGQGMNAAFEDVRELAEQLDKHLGRPRTGQETRATKDSLAAALTTYYKRRKENADAIAEMAVDNFIEMRDKVASPAFRWKKKFSHALHGLMPGWYIPLYEMVSFTTIPYATARRRARKQTAIVTGIVLTLLAMIAGFVVGAVRDGM